jgi:ABC-type amino acid transport substrate-binding protein
MIGENAPLTMHAAKRTIEELTRLDGSPTSPASAAGEGVLRFGGLHRGPARFHGKAPARLQGAARDGGARSAAVGEVVMAMARHLGAAVAVAWALLATAAQAGTLDDIRKNGVLRIAFREDAPPFSFKREGPAAPAGFMVDLCRAVAAGLGKAIGLAELKLAYVSVSSTDRFEAITGARRTSCARPRPRP